MRAPLVPFGYGCGLEGRSSAFVGRFVPALIRRRIEEARGGDNTSAVFLAFTRDIYRKIWEAISTDGLTVTEPEARLRL